MKSMNETVVRAAQREQYAGVGSVDHDELLAHVTMLGRIASSFELPVVLSTSNGCSGIRSRDAR